MNVLSIEKRAQILGCLVEGCSMRATGRLTGANKKTIERLLVSAGEACAAYMDKIMVGLNCKVLQVDELHSFTYCRRQNKPEALRFEDGIGDTWTWLVIDADTKIIPVWHVGNRTAVEAKKLVTNLEPRLNHRVQITSDGHTAYLEAVPAAFNGEVDYAQLVKVYGPSLQTARYAPPKFVGATKRRIAGHPDKALVSTSYVERVNLALRMSNRRYTRLTNAFSKKLENHKLMLALTIMHYNFCRIHQTLRVTPAMEAGIADHVWGLEEIINLIS
jgi:IS1 family transposase